MTYCRHTKNIRLKYEGNDHDPYLDNKIHYDGMNSHF